MAHTVIIHMLNEDPIVAEMEELPGPEATSISFTNPRRRDGKALHYLTYGSVAYIFAMHRVNFIEVMAPREETDVIEFFRE
jgi:hypothetical protein